MKAAQPYETVKGTKPCVPLFDAVGERAAGLEGRFGFPSPTLPTLPYLPYLESERAEDLEGEEAPVAAQAHIQERHQHRRLRGTGRQQQRQRGGRGGAR